MLLQIQRVSWMAARTTYGRVGIMSWSAGCVQPKVGNPTELRGHLCERFFVDIPDRQQGGGGGGGAHMRIQWGRSDALGASKLP